MFWVEVGISMCVGLWFKIVGSSTCAGLWCKCVCVYGVASVCGGVECLAVGCECVGLSACLEVQVGRCMINVW